MVLALAIVLSAPQLQLETALLARVDGLLAAPGFEARREIVSQAVRQKRVTFRSMPKFNVVEIHGPGGHDHSNPDLLFQFTFTSDGHLDDFLALDIPRPDTFAPTIRPIAEIERRRVQGYVRAMMGETSTVELHYGGTDIGGFSFSEYDAFPQWAGRPIRSGNYYVRTTEGVLGQITDYGTRDHGDVATLGGAAVLNESTLRAKAIAACAEWRAAHVADAPWYFVRREGVEIGPNLYRLPGEPLTTQAEAPKPWIPLYRRTECYASQNFEIDVLLDARTGRRLRIEDDRGRLGGGGAPAVPKIPRLLTMDGVTSPLTALDQRSFTPPGRRIEIPFGDYTLIARHVPERRSVWIATDKKQGYYAYQVSPELNRVLIARAKR